MRSVQNYSREPAPEEPCCLKLSLTIGLPTGEPSDYVLQYEGKVLAGEDLNVPVGDMTLHVVDLYRAVLDEMHPIDVLDNIDSGLAHFCELISSRSMRFKPSIARVAGDDIGRVLVLGHLNLQKAYRGRGIGLSAINAACSGLGGNCLIAVLKAFPTQWEGTAEEGGEAFRRDQAKLVQYYRRALFAPVLGKGFMARSLGSPMD
jgi:hypothetical protein